jgi:hypothetical protein
VPIILHLYEVMGLSEIANPSPSEQAGLNQKIKGCQKELEAMEKFAGMQHRQIKVALLFL